MLLVPMVRMSKRCRSEMFCVKRTLSARSIFVAHHPLGHSQQAGIDSQTRVASRSKIYAELKSVVVFGEFNHSAGVHKTTSFSHGEDRTSFDRFKNFGDDRVGRIAEDDHLTVTGLGLLLHIEHFDFPATDDFASHLLS